MKFFNVEFLGSLMLELFLGLRVNILYVSLNFPIQNEIRIFLYTYIKKFYYFCYISFEKYNEIFFYRNVFVTRFMTLSQLKSVKIIVLYFNVR